MPYRMSMNSKLKGEPDIRLSSYRDFCNYCDGCPPFQEYSNQLARERAVMKAKIDEARAREFEAEDRTREAKARADAAEEAYQTNSVPGWSKSGREKKNKYSESEDDLSGYGSCRDNLPCQSSGKSTGSLGSQSRRSKNSYSGHRSHHSSSSSKKNAKKRKGEKKKASGGGGGGDDSSSSSHGSKSSRSVPTFVGGVSKHRYDGAYNKDKPKSKLKLDVTQFPELLERTPLSKSGLF